MKKSILLLIGLCIGIYANSQTKSKIPTHLLNKHEKMVKVFDGSEFPVIFNQSNPYVTSTPSKDLGVPLGITYYDLQSNSTVGNRMLVSGSNIYAVWTFAPNSTTGYPDRGTGFNKSTNLGTNWAPGPTARIEGSVTKTGWPNIGKLNNGSLVIACHGYTPTQGAFNKSTNEGANWETNYMGGATLGLVWCRMVTNGNTIHVIGHTVTTSPYAGFDKGALVYVKSTDNGTNWTDPIQPTGLDTSNYSKTSPFSDAYAFDGIGDTLAIVYGDAFRTTALIKSTNGGTSWTYKAILNLPIKKFDTEGTLIYDINGDNQEDNVYDNDGCNYVILDKTGKAHVFFGRQRYNDDGAGAGHFYFPYMDGLWYWNEDMGTINYQYKWTMIGTTNTYEGIPDTVAFPIITEIYDIDNSGEIEFPDNGSNYPFGPYGNSLSSQPAAVVLPNGTIHLWYASIVENTDGTVGTEHRAFRNIWHIAKGPGNSPWSYPPLRVAEDDFTEQVYPCVARAITGSASPYNAHFFYQGDGYPGNSWQPQSGNPHGIVENTIYYLKPSVPEVVGINEINVVKSAPVVYPNPASGNVTVSYNLTEASNVTFGIYNLVGQQIMSSTKYVTSGEVNVALNIETLPQGIYFIKSDIGSKTYTNKLVVR